MLQLVAATYFMVSGGPYGTEEIVGNAGYAGAIVILLLTPLLWSVPTALMVGELSAALPQDGGYYVWVRRALGPFWGFQEAWLSLAASVFDMAIYPTLFVLYLARFWPAATTHGLWIEAAVIIGCGLWNLRGAAAVGSSSIWLGVLLLAPFAVITALGAWPGAGGGGGVGNGAAVAPPAHPGLVIGILIAMWNNMGWDNASTIAGEVAEPQKTYPRAILVTVAAVTASYIFPVAAAWRIGIPVEAWTGGAWVNIGDDVGALMGAKIAVAHLGDLLRLAIIAGGTITAVGMYNSLVMSYSRLPLAMARDGLLPRIFARQSANGTPWFAVLACSAAWMLSLGLSFDRLITFDMLLYGASLVLEFVALVALRLREPELPRSFRVPGGVPGTILVGIAPTALVVLALVKNKSEQFMGHSALLGGALIMLAGMAAYLIPKGLWSRTSAPVGSLR